MSIRFTAFWNRVGSSFWFVPSIMTIVACGLSFAMIAIDESIEAKIISKLGWLYTNKPEGAREVLSTIAGSMITVAGVVFSITIVALSLASQQFGPRLLRNFMRDRGNQIVLGTFISTYFYCLLILRTIRSGDETEFVPHLSVLAGVVLAIISLGVLIYFIHHVSESIQVSNVIERVSLDLKDGIRNMFPQQIGEDTSTIEQLITDWETQGLETTVLLSPESGFLQGIDHRKILQLNADQQQLMEVLVTPGVFIVKDQPLANIYSQTRNSEEEIEKLKKSFIIGIERSLEQDLLFPINQLAEIALRALSPSINDPFTAMACLDKLSEGLCLIAACREPSAYRKDEQNVVRLKAQPVLFKEAVSESYNQIRLYAKENPLLMIYFMERLKLVACCVKINAHKQALMHQVERTYKDGIDYMHDPHLKEKFTTLYNELKRDLIS